MPRTNAVSDDLPDDQLARAMTLRNGVVAVCEGRNKMDDDVYRILRRELINDPELGKFVPQFIRTSHDTAALWAFLKDYNGQWEPRRQLVRSEFAPLLDHLERGPSPADAVIGEALATYDADGVREAWRKALARRDADPEGAITAARTLLETVCKHLLEDGQANASYDDADDLPKLYRRLSEKLNLAPTQHSEDAFKRILGSAASVVEGLGTLRNKIGDAHASGRRTVKPSARHAALAVNMAGSMAMFLVETAAAASA